MSKCTCFVIRDFVRPNTPSSRTGIERCNWCKQNEAIAEKAREVESALCGDTAKPGYSKLMQELKQLVQNSLPAAEKEPR